jgi:hypothetical protein
LIIVLMFVSIAFGLTVIAFTFTHIHLIFKNITTIEFYEKSVNREVPNPLARSFSLSLSLPLPLFLCV